MKVKNYIIKIISLVILLSGISAQSATTTYYHNDLLGTPVAATDKIGNILWRQQTLPFGQEIDSPNSDQTNNDINYTGHQRDDEFGLTYMQARYYDPVIGRFYSNDPVRFSNIHNFNRYAYANNNPYKYVDPDGNSSVAVGAGVGCAVTGPACPAGAAAGAVVGVVVDVAIIAAAGIIGYIVLDEVVNGDDVSSEGSTNLADDDATTHILDGDEDGGGHGPGRGISGKSEFPSDWTDDGVMDGISDVATDPNSKTKPARDGRTKVSGKRDGIKIDVILGNESENGRIITAWPNNVPRNPEKKNETE